MKIENATASQTLAINSKEPEILCVAGPGAGKTATTVLRIERLLNDGVRANRIAALTFTNAAAGELERRLPKQDSPIELGFVGTLHAFCLRMLKQHGGPFGYGERISVISPEAAEDLLASKAKSLGCKSPMTKLLALKAKGMISKSGELDEIVVGSYLSDMKATGIVDYDLILQEFLAMISPTWLGAAQVIFAIESEFSHLFVDEVQDSSELDWRIYEALPIRNKFYVGDADQAVYSWRGGRVDGMIRKAGDPKVEVVKIEENFRSHSEICDAANRLISHNKDRLPKETISVKGKGGWITLLPPCENEGYEIGTVARAIKETLLWTQDIAVITRTNHVADAFRRTLTATGIPVVNREIVALPRDWILARTFINLAVNPDNDVLAFFHLVALYEKKGANPAEARKAAHAARKQAASVGRSLNSSNVHVGRITKPRVALEALAGSGVSKEAHLIAVEKYQELPAGATMVEFAMALEEVREHVKEPKGAEGVRVMTVHGSKGREFDSVFLVGFEDEAIPGRAAKVGEHAIAEERRLAYVALTRARKALTISTSASRITEWKQIVARTPSRFINELLP